MKKTLFAVAIASVASFAFAEEADASASSGGWPLTLRFQAGGMGRGCIKAKTPVGSQTSELWGPEGDVFVKAYGTDKFNLWLGVGGTWGVEKEVFSFSQGQWGGGGLVYGWRDGKADLEYAECRVLAMPEWKACKWASLAARLGCAFDWVGCEARYNSGLDIYSAPGVLAASTADHSRMNKTEFVAAAILGLQANVFIADNFGLYGYCDYRPSGDASFGSYGKVELSGWQAGAGVLVEF